MGHHRYTDHVDYAAQSVVQCGYPTEDMKLAKLTNPEDYSNGEFCDDPEPVLINGWSYETYESIGRQKEITGDRWIKEGFEPVFVVNEDQYCHVGEYDLSIASTQREAIADFLTSFELPLQEIHSNVRLDYWS